MNDFADLCEDTAIMLQQMSIRYKLNNTISLASHEHLKCPLATLVNSMSKIIVMITDSVKDLPK